MTRRRGQLAPGVALIALFTGALVGAAGGGEAFWLCLPAVLLATSAARKRSEAVLSAAVIVLAATVPLTGWLHTVPAPSP